MNKNDVGSKTIANHYCKLRFIPPRNVFEIDYRGSEEITAVHILRKDFFEPIFNEMARRKLTDQIDYIVYSSGFPYGVSITSDFPGVKLDGSVGTMGSLTGLTYLNQVVRARDKSYIDLMQPTNAYATHNVTPDATRGFRSRYGWTPSGRRSPSVSRQYFLSTMLGYTAGRGNTVEEVIHYLRRSALADASRPRGTIYFVQNENIRSTTRASHFAAVAEHLQNEGVRAEIIQGVLPERKLDVMGAVIGYSNFSWAKSGSRILPGAIIEHLTSFGGVLKEGASQTPLTEFLRYGAAGSSGTIMEPRANIVKFPHPNIHLHYARGCSLAESFYQSILNPYQILVVGDPLCMPWARIPVVDVDGITSKVVKGKIKLRPKSRGLTRIEQFRLFVDGRIIQECPPHGELSVDTTKISDGYHELRVVAVEESPIECQGRRIIPISVSNSNRHIAVRASKKQVQSNERFRVSVNAPTATEVMVFHRRTRLANMTRSRGDLLIDASQLGHGPVELTVIATSGRGAANAWIANPIEIDVIAAPVVNQNPTPLPPNFSFQPEEK